MLAIAYAYEQARGPRPTPTVASELTPDAQLPALEPQTYNACVEDIALTARRIQGDEFRDVTPEAYLSYVTDTMCSLPTHVAGTVTLNPAHQAYEIENERLLDSA